MSERPLRVLVLTSSTGGGHDSRARALRAWAALAAGEAVAEYVGERITKAESARRQAAGGQVFIFEVDEQTDLDGDSPDNPARFANHSCEPNGEAAAVSGRVYLRALRAIEAGEELTFDYGYRLAAFPGYPCRCGAPSCPGFIVAQSERRGVRRLLNRPARQLARGGKIILQEAGA